METRELFKTVVVLGAGASRGSAFRLPLMSDMLDAQYVKTSPYRALKQALTLYGRRGRRTDLEDFLTQLELTSEVYLERWRTGSDAEFARIAVKARRELEEFIADRLGTVRCGSADHVDLFRLLRPGDSIVTVNYDQVADYSLLEVGGETLHATAEPDSLLERSYRLLGTHSSAGRTGGSMGDLDRDGGYFLKLHGSVSWLSCARDGCVNHQEIIEPRTQLPADRVTAGEPCRACGAVLHRVIVAPTLAKQFNDSPRLELLWHLAHRELSEASYLIVVGLSLPRSDARLSWLLSSSFYFRSNRNKNRLLTVVNPDLGARDRVAEACRGKLVEHFESLAEFLTHASTRGSLLPGSRDGGHDSEL